MFSYDLESVACFEIFSFVVLLNCLLQLTVCCARFIPPPPYFQYTSENPSEMNDHGPTDHMVCSVFSLEDASPTTQRLRDHTSSVQPGCGSHMDGIVGVYLVQQSIQLPQCSCYPKVHAFNFVIHPQYLERQL